MKMKSVLPAIALATFFCTTGTLRAQGTAFTYQGSLQMLSGSISGNYTGTIYLDFALYGTQSGGSPVAGGGPIAPVGGAQVNVNNGLLTVTLDFGSSPNPFTGQPLWLEIDESTSGIPGTFTALSPRQPLTEALYAIFATTAGNLNLNPSSPIIYSGSQTLLQAIGTQNFFAGIGAGNLTMSGAANTGVGWQALISNINGVANEAIGTAALEFNTGGSQNTANGNGVMEFNTVGSDNTASGFQALRYNTTGSYNTANGDQALYYNTNGTENVASGYRALYNNLGGSYNEAYGDSALFSNTNGSDNVANGYLALQNLSSGGGNIALGTAAGQNLASGNNNIYIGNPGAGTGFSSTESDIIRIGNTGVQTACYIAGTVYANGVALTSDRNAKENFQPVDSQAVLAKVAALPVTEWNYKTDQAGVQHIGPMAQDFQAAFGLDGADDKHISVVDEGGVALAAIKGLNQKLNEKDSEIQKLEQRLENLEQQMNQKAGGSK